MLYIYLYIFASSVYTYMLESKFKVSGKSFMNIINSKGPNIEPCGIPLRTEAHLETNPFILTRCLLFLRKAAIQSISKGSSYIFLIYLIIFYTEPCRRLFQNQYTVHRPVTHYLDCLSNHLLLLKAVEQLNDSL